MTKSFHPLTSKDLRPKKRSKYGNTKCQFKSMAFDSVLERDRYIFLESQQKEGKIKGLERQVPYPLHVNGKLICTLIIDHEYMVTGECVITIEDAKGIITPEAVIKLKLYEALYHLPVHIVTKKNLTSLPDAQD